MDYGVHKYVPFTKNTSLNKLIKSIGAGAAFGNTQLSQTNSITSLGVDRIADFPSHVSNADARNRDTNNISEYQFRNTLINIILSSETFQR
jgi:hypothetical protein